jgi:threonine synthase
VKYVSTRGSAPVLEFEDVLLTGLAADGGLYVPAEWPVFSADQIRAMRAMSYEEIALTVMAPLIGDAVDGDDLEKIVREAYGNFSHDAVVPLSQLAENHWLLELYHGPTLAFKDVAMQVLSRLMDHALKRRSTRASVVVATSGDTGGAAIEAFRGRDAVDVFVLHPHGKVSEVQRRQMATVLDANVHNIAIEGTFDDCQSLVKAMFNDQVFRKRSALAGVNSINWARIMAQTVYYFSSAVALGAPDRPVSFCVPTGNFGDVYSGYAAKQMGLDIETLVIATNVNDILARAMKSGRYETYKVVPTVSPSMDIQVSSNFERLLFEVYVRNSDDVVRLMSGLQQSGAFSIAKGPLKAITSQFSADRTDEAETAATILSTLRETGKLVDPHTAVALHVANGLQRDSAIPMITFSTAHPAKFPDAVKEASGIYPALPQHLSDLSEREERLAVLPNELDAVQTFIDARSRAYTESNQ